MAKIAVERLFPRPEHGPDLATNVWASASVREALVWYQKRKETHRGFFIGKLHRYAKDGFALWHGEGRPIRHEWDQVYRIGHDSCLFRVIGFYAGGYQREFIACDAYLKGGTKLNRSERDRINAVASVRATGSWHKVGSDGQPT